MTKDEVIGRLMGLRDMRLSEEIMPGIHVCSTEFLNVIRELAGEAVKQLEAAETEVTIPIYDEEELHHGCTVHVLRNSSTGETRLEWWKEGEWEGECDCEA